MTERMDDRGHWAEGAHRSIASWRQGPSLGAKEYRGACVVNARSVTQMESLTKSKILVNEGTVYRCWRACGLFERVRVLGVMVLSIALRRNGTLRKFVPIVQNKVQTSTSSRED